MSNSAAISLKNRYDYISTENPAIDINPPSIPATWLNINTGEVFTCTDNTDGDNIWVGNWGHVIRSSVSVDILNFDASASSVLGWSGNIFWRSSDWGGLGACFCVGSVASPSSYYRIDMQSAALLGFNGIGIATYSWDKQDHTDGDKGGGSLRFLNSDKTVLSQQIYSPVNETTKKRVTLELAVPADAYYVDILVTGSRVYGTECSAMVTNFELVFSL